MSVAIIVISTVGSVCNMLHYQEAHHAKVQNNLSEMRSDCGHVISRCPDMGTLPRVQGACLGAVRCAHG